MSFLISKQAMFAISLGGLAAMASAGPLSRGCAPSLMATAPAGTGALRGPAESPGREDRKITARGSFPLGRWPWLLYPAPFTEEQVNATPAVGDGRDAR
jgi:hypothetical protein